MIDSSDSDEGIFAPRSGLRKSWQSSQINCDRSITPTTCTSKSANNSKLKSRLSLSQKKKQPCDPKEDSNSSWFESDSPPHRAQPSHLQTGKNSSYTSLKKPPPKRSKLDKDQDFDFSSDDDSTLMLTPKTCCPKIIIRRSQESKNPTATSLNPSSTQQQQVKDSPIKCRDGMSCPNPSPAHRNAYSHLENSDSISTIESSIISLKIPHLTRLSNKFGSELFDNESSRLSSGNQQSQQRTFSTVGETKQDFIQYWVDSWEIGSVPNSSDGESTQPFPITQAELFLADIPEPDLTGVFIEQVEVENKSKNKPLASSPPSSKGKVISSRGMVTPVKAPQTPKSSTSSGKQTAITNYFTPRSNGIVKSAVEEADVSKVQNKTNIAELGAISATEELEMITLLDEVASSTPPSRQNAKDQWSFIMSRMNMRGTASNVQKEIKEAQNQSKRPRPSKSFANNDNNKLESTVGDAGPSTERKCPFYKLIPGTGFAIDAFCYGRVKGVTSYFLSHFHYDHYRGLGKWLDKPVYCSQVTANLVNMKIKPNPNLIRVLPLNESRLIEKVEVILIDANHCPGKLTFKRSYYFLVNTGY